MSFFFALCETTKPPSVADEKFLKVSYICLGNAFPSFIQKNQHYGFENYKMNAEITIREHHLLNQKVSSNFF